MDGRITYWNRGAEDLFGWTADEALGRVAHEVLQTVWPEPFADIAARLLRTGRWQGELVHTRRDGTRIAVATRWALQRDASGNPVAHLVTANDVTEEKHAADALRRNEEWWRPVFEHNCTMYFMIDPAGTVLSVNRFGAEQLGYGVESWSAILPRHVPRSRSGSSPEPPGRLRRPVRSSDELGAPQGPQGRNGALGSRDRQGDAESER
jgi:PAS domain S-box-containing protein